MFATIHEHSPVSPRLALVTASFVGGDVSRQDEMLDAITASLGGSAVAVRGSWSWVDPEHKETAIGFVSSARQTVVIEGQEPDPSKFHRVQANVYVDKGDETVWNMAEGAGGKYLTRSGQDDLRSVLEAARHSPTGSTPRLARINRANATVHDVVGFVAEGRNVAEMDYGVVVEVGNGALMVMSTLQDGALVTVPETHVASVMELTPEGRPQVSASAVTRIKASRVTAADGMNDTSFDRSMNPAGPLTPQEYWKLAYRDQNYINMILKQVAEVAAL
jgi:hypothetical protein